MQGATALINLMVQVDLRRLGNAVGNLAELVDRAPSRHALRKRAGEDDRHQRQSIWVAELRQFLHQLQAAIFAML